MNTKDINIMQSTWLDTHDVARPVSEGGYGIAEQTQSKLRMKRAIPFIKVGKFVRYGRAELDKWLESHTVVSA